MKLPEVLCEAAIRFGEFRGAPSIQLRNIESVAKRYGNHRPKPRVVAAGQMLGKLLYAPRIEMTPKAEDMLGRHVDNDGVIILTSNHVRWMDPLILTTCLKKTPTLQRVNKDMIIPTKPSLFKIPGLRWAVEGMGSFVTFREKDAMEEDGDISSEDRAYLAKSGAYTVATIVDNLVAGGNAAAFVEGTRNKGDPLIVQEILGGVALMHKRAVKLGANVAELPVGIYYDQSNRGATVYFGEVYTPPQDMKLRQHTDFIQEQVQGCVTTAFELAKVA